MADENFRFRKQNANESNQESQVNNPLDAVNQFRQQVSESNAQEAVAPPTNEMAGLQIQGAVPPAFAAALAAAKGQNPTQIGRAHV